MERSPLFLGELKKHSKNDNLTESNLQIQCKRPLKVTATFLTELIYRFNVNVY